MISWIGWFLFGLGTLALLLTVCIVIDCVVEELRMINHAFRTWNNNYEKAMRKAYPEVFDEEWQEESDSLVSGGVVGNDREREVGSGRNLSGDFGEGEQSEIDPRS